jgi:hypothetical protein
MRPLTDRWGIYINGILAIRLYRSDMPSGSNRSGFAMWSYDCRSFGKIRDGTLLIESVAAANLLNGDLTPQWQATPVGGRLLHPRYSLEVEGSGTVWVPKITDELSGRSHCLRPTKTYDGAVSLLEDLLRRRVGREIPTELYQPYGPFGDLVRPIFKILTAIIVPALVRDHQLDPGRWTTRQPRLSVLVPMARSIDALFGGSFDPVPLIGTIMGGYIKWALLTVYGGAASISFCQGLPPVEFTIEQLTAFRDRFRQHPMTDEDYLEFVSQHFIVPLRKLRRKGRGLCLHRPATRDQYQPQLRPRRDRGDYPICWPLPPGTRLFKPYRDRQVRRRLPQRA